MERRRDFLKYAAALGARSVFSSPFPKLQVQAQPGTPAELNERTYWLAVLERLARPVLENLARGELKKNMPVEAANPDRKKYTHLEALGRLLAGIAPWLAAGGLNESETKQQQKFVSWAQASLDAATDPKSADFMNFHDGSQPLVDAAFLAQGILRAPQILWFGLDMRARKQLIAALRSSRVIPTPDKNNWVLFAAMIEAALQTMGENTVEERLEACLRRMQRWYAGDGAYGDGEFFHFDYYNSFVIHPMLLDVLAVVKQKDHEFEGAYAMELQRARRYADILERLIAPDGTFPSMGRSTTYRFGAFHALAQVSLMRELPEHLKPAQVRCGMSAVIFKMIEAPGTFDEGSWLTIGFCGHQPSLAESYISTGSLYLCATALLPLGLSPSDAFWSAPAMPWTSQRIWSGEALPADHALVEPSATRERSS